VGHISPDVSQSGSRTRVSEGRGVLRDRTLSRYRTRTTEHTHVLHIKILDVVLARLTFTTEKIMILSAKSLKQEKLRKVETGCVPEDLNRRPSGLQPLALKRRWTTELFNQLLHIGPTFMTALLPVFHSCRPQSSERVDIAPRHKPSR